MVIMNGLESRGVTTDKSNRVVCISLSFLQCYRQERLSSKSPPALSSSGTTAAKEASSSMSAIGFAIASSRHAFCELLFRAVLLVSLPYHSPWLAVSDLLFELPGVLRLLAGGGVLPPRCRRIALVQPLLLVRVPHPPKRAAACWSAPRPCRMLLRALLCWSSVQLDGRESPSMGAALSLPLVNENAPRGGVGHWLARTILCENLGDSNNVDLEKHLMVIVVSKGDVLAKLTWQPSIRGEELLWRADRWRANGGLPCGGS
ncbi:hypothetical protein Syun_012056 [Stephania yunnanensis]|uniref:Uncharacterized protein n=1 Tax=Stephania yunnanensis TaxID=152371 RepID=A0AAP0JYP9_9MAGN